MRKIELFVPFQLRSSFTIELFQMMCTKKRTPTLSIDKKLQKYYTTAYQLLHQLPPVDTFIILLPSPILCLLW